MLATIDIGSNTVQSLLARIDRDRLVDKQTRIWTTRLGNAGLDGKLTEKSIADTAAAVAQAMEDIRKAQVKQARMLATSAVRDAGNSQELAAAIYHLAPDAPPLEILSGIQEAETSNLGARSCCNAPDDWPVIDVGGSSAEVIYQTPTGFHCVSHNIGAVRAAGRGWGREEIARMVQEGYSPYNEARGAIGVGGTITAVAGVCLGLEAYDRDRIEGYSLSYNELAMLMERLLPLDIPGRCLYSPLLSRRGEIICEGLAIWLSLMETLHLDELQVTCGGILDGAAMEMLMKQEWR